MSEIECTKEQDPTIPWRLYYALRAWSGNEPSQSLLALAVDEWLAAEKLDEITKQRDELLAACHDALNNLPEDGECARLIRAAIAKAEAAS